MQHSYYVYIVQCSDGSYYIGVTNNLNRRISEHNEGIIQTAYTYKRRPVVLKYSQHFTDINNAIAWEKQLKGWSRKKKEALIEGNWDMIKELAKSNSGKLSNKASTGSA
jgi:putative endonuclease